MLTITKETIRNGERKEEAFQQSYHTIECEEEGNHKYEKINTTPTYTWGGYEIVNTKYKLINNKRESSKTCYK